MQLTSFSLTDYASAIISIMIYMIHVAVDTESSHLRQNSESVPASTVTAAESQSTESMVQRHSSAELATPVVRLQCELRQLLQSLVDSSYSITDVEYLKEAVASARAQLKSFQDHGDQAARRTAFRRSRRLVRTSIAANSLRRRLSVVRAKRRQMKLQRRHPREHAHDLTVSEVGIYTVCYDFGFIIAAVILCM